MIPGRIADFGEKRWLSLQQGWLRTWLAARGGRPGNMSDQLGFILADGTFVQPHNPFFIMGSGRCGTTLMRRLVIEQTGAVIPPENYILARSRGLMVMAANDWELFCRLTMIGLRDHSAHWADFRIDEIAAYRLLVNIPTPFRSIANFWQGFHAIYASRLNKPSGSAWGDKTPVNVDGLGEIIEIFPDARFVFMIRDVFDMAYSYALMSAMKHGGNYLQGAERWVACNTLIQAFLERFDSQSIVVRYEDLARFPDREMSLVLAHLGLPRSAQSGLNALEAAEIGAAPNFEHVLGGVTSDFIGKGRAMLPPAVKKDIAEIAVWLQISFDYEPTGAVIWS